MSLWRALARRELSLSGPRHRVDRSLEWVAMRDGTRLATASFRPDLDPPRSRVLVRSAAPLAGGRSALCRIASVLAERGHAVSLQVCRGLHDSEGRFEPFVNERSDGADALEWLAPPDAAAAPRVLIGFGYGGHAAWSALAGTGLPVDALLVGFAARDPYAWLHAGGALRLDVALALAAGLAAAEPRDARPPDLDRALAFRPVREADRVALRRIDWLRDWLDHPRRDDFWQERTPPLPEGPIAVTLLGRWQDATLPSQLDDAAALLAAPSPPSRPTPRLRVGPWMAEAGRWRDAPGVLRALREIAGEVAVFLETVAGGGARRAAPVRTFALGAGTWRDLATWPPAGAGTRCLYLHGDGREGGRLETRLPAESEPPDVFVYDPADATPGSHAPTDRGDALRYTSEPFAAPLELLGTPEVEIFAASDAPRTDFTAALWRLGADGATPLSEGILRDGTRESVGDATRISFPLSPTGVRIGVGERLRLELASSRFPHFDRHPNAEVPPARAGDDDGRPARQCVWHDEVRASRLLLPTARAADAATAGTRAAAETAPDVASGDRSPDEIGPAGARRRARIGTEVQP